MKCSREHFLGTPCVGPKLIVISGKIWLHSGLCLALYFVLCHSLLVNICTFLLTDESMLSGQDDVDEIVDFLRELAEGEVLRSIVCDVIVQDCLDVSQSSQELRCANSGQSSSSFQSLLATWSNDSVSNCSEHKSTSFLDLLLDLVIKLHFPEKLVNFLLQLLPDQEYKVCMTQPC